MIRLLALVMVGCGSSWSQAEESIDYSSKIKPILRARCFACHGPLKQESGLRLDTATSILKGGNSGAAIKVGDSEESFLIARIIATDIEQRMPPEHEGEVVPASEVELLRKWIDTGATAPANEQPDPGPEDHWSFRPVQRPEVPVIASVIEAKPTVIPNPIDAFVLRLCQEQGLEVQKSAKPEILLRRLYIDLIGLPPPPEEFDRLPQEFDLTWYSQLVERLLNDPRYGERWGRHWMDVWRYSDWWGLGDQLRNSQLHIWHWRDWIIESLNEDMPYDKMIELMLAGDEIEPTNLSQLRATGFLARNYFLFNRNQWMDDTVEHVSKSMLGLTMNCAKCHDHKYDPIKQTDFYRMRAIFEPYHVRLDQVEGEVDLNRNAIPRVFDGLPELPTYRFVRGQENSPDKSKVIAPGVPEFFKDSNYSAAPVSLPPVAWQPARQPWVAKDRIAAQAARVESFEKELAAALTRLQEAEKQQAEMKLAAAKSDGKGEPAEEKELLHDTFATLNETKWQIFGGDWKHEPGKLQQMMDGMMRSALRWKGEAPRDFDVTIRFTLHGGSVYRSLGLSFDCSQENALGAATPTDSEQMVYISAHAPGPKVQGSFQQGGAFQYPDAARTPRSVELNRAYTLQIQVRGDLINAQVDGEPALAWRTPLARRNGFMQITTFDAMASIHEVTIKPLSPTTVLREPGGNAAPGSEESVKQLQLEVAIADSALKVAQAELRSLELRAVAMKATWDREDYEAAIGTDAGAANPDDKAKLEASEKVAISAAVKSERESALAKSIQTEATAELNLFKATKDKKEAVQKELDAAKQAVVKARETLQMPGSDYTKLTGAQWTPTRFFNSGVDDPKVEFQKVSTGRRLALAKWIANKSNPLTARVAVNQIWSRHLGEPLMPTVFDFGMKAPAPIHHQLIDWLAAEFMDNQWSMKHLHRVIVMSELYRRSSSLAGMEGNMAKDPDNRYLWRRLPIRVESQVVRDSILSLASVLDERRGGPPVMPGEQADSKRRSLYFFHSNNERNLFLSTFDEALVKECYRREQNIIPQQALALSNSRLVLDSVALIEKRLSGDTMQDEEFIRRSFLVLLGVVADEAMVEASKKAMEQWSQLPEGGGGQGVNYSPRSLLIWSLLNHNDFVTMR